jgi:hypothetical protein
MTKLKIASIKQAMKQDIEQAEENDPKALKSRIRLLEAERDGIGSELLKLQNERPRVHQVEVPVVDQKTLDGIDELRGKILTEIKRISEDLLDIKGLITTAHITKKMDQLTSASITPLPAETRKDVGNST